jgi:hypothetical protein
MDPSHIVFFFGSGVSFPSGMPKMDKITEYVFRKTLERKSNGRYVFSDAVESRPSEIVGTTRNFLTVIRNYAQSVLESEVGKGQSQSVREINYEDLLYLCRVIRDDQDGTLSNLAVRPFSEKIRTDASSFLLKSKHGGDERPGAMNDLAYTADEAAWLISGVVREALSRPVDEKTLESSFEPLVDALKDEEISRVTIITLNHDLLVERLLKLKGIQHADGFGPKDGELRFFKPNLLFERRNEVTLIKPHGSINWYAVRRHDQDIREQRYAISSSDNPDVIRNEEGRRYVADFLEPTILAGLEKEKVYQTDIFGDMMEAALQALRQTNVVIESGFGWQDYGMHSLLMRYLKRDKSNRLLPLHPEDGLPNTLFDAPEYFRPEGIVRTLPQYMSHDDVSWTKIKEVLELP